MFLKNARDIPAEEVEEGATGTRIRWVIGDNVGAPNFHMRLFTLAPGGSTPLHEHPWEHEVFILRGEGVVVGGTDEHAFGPEDVIYVEPSERHQFRNTGDGDVELICVIPTPTRAR
ncbi:MAG: cupin domain-containing protein [Armatimonadota bacterium]